MVGNGKEARLPLPPLEIQGCWADGKCTRSVSLVTSSITPSINLYYLNFSLLQLNLLCFIDQPAAFNLHPLRPPVLLKQTPRLSKGRLSKEASNNGISETQRRAYTAVYLLDASPTWPNHHRFSIQSSESEMTTTNYESSRIARWPGTIQKSL